ncbi:MAG TPA: type II toxin-antitoxin system VapB family antitoxin [Acidisarcina sp.]
MRTNIEIDDELMKQAMESGEEKTKRAVVKAALRLFVRTRSQASIRNLRGKVQWEGDLAASRLTRFPDWDQEK